MKIIASLTVLCAATALAGTAAAAEVRIPWGDLDLGSPAGAAVFDARIHAAARRLCRDTRRPAGAVSARVACRAAVRAEALDQLPETAWVDYARARGAVAV